MARSVKISEFGDHLGHITSPSDCWAAVAQLMDGHPDLDPPRQEPGAAELVVPFEFVALGEQLLDLPRRPCHARYRKGFDH